MASDDGILKDFMPGIATVAVFVLKRNNLIIFETLFPGYDIPEK